MGIAVLSVGSLWVFNLLIVVDVGSVGSVFRAYTKKTLLTEEYATHVFSMGAMKVFPQPPHSPRFNNNQQVRLPTEKSENLFLWGVT